MDATDAHHSIFLGPNSGTNCPNTFWMDTQSTATDGSYVPLYMGYFDTRQAFINGSETISGDLSVGGNLTAASFTGNAAGLTNETLVGNSIPTNAMSSWPTAPASPGAISLVNSNGTLYELQSGANGLTWVATNLIGEVH